MSVFSGPVAVLKPYSMLSQVPQKANQEWPYFSPCAKIFTLDFFLLSEFEK